MKGISTLLLVFGCLAIATQATYLRVIHAVPPGDMKMDVYYTAMDTGEKIRLFQDLNYTDIPPYFFVPVTQQREPVMLSFLLKSSSMQSQELVPQQQLQNLPSHTVFLRPNLTYTLVVTQSQGQSSQGQQGQNMDLEYLLLNDYSQGDDAPEGMKFIRLINLAPDAESISLVDANTQCPEESQGQQDQESQGQSGQEEEQSQDQGQEGQDQGQQGNQTEGEISQPIVEQLGYLEATDYVELTQMMQPTSLFVCYQGQKISVTPAPLYQAAGSRFSILLFTGSQQSSQQGSQEQGQEDQGEQGEQEQGQDDQGQQQEQSQFIAYVVSDEPLTIQNVRIRIVHAESSLPSVNVLLDGQQIFDRVTFGNVTEYHMTVRGIHNVSVSASGQQSGQQGNASSIRIITFFAWTKSYSIAIVRTSSGGIGLESQGTEEQSGNQDQEQEGNQNQDLQMGSQALTRGQPTQGALFPGFLGDLHKVFVDDFSQNATLGNNYAYIQVVHLASGIGAINVNIGEETIPNIRFLQSSQYRSVMATSQEVPIRVSLASTNSPAFALNTRLQPGTLYTLWALQDTSSESVNIFLTKDRQVQIQCVVMDSQMMGQQGSQGQDQQESE